MSTHMDVHKGFLSTATACPGYPRRFVQVGECRKLAHLGAFIGITTVTSWEKAANHMAPLLQSLNHMTLFMFTNFDTVSHAHCQHSSQYFDHGLWTSWCNKETMIPQYQDLNTGGSGVVLGWWFLAEYHYHTVPWSQSDPHGNIVYEYKDDINNRRL